MTIDSMHGIIKRKFKKKIYTRLSHWNMTYFLVIRSLSKSNLKYLVIIFSQILWQIICKVVCPKFQLSINYLQWTIFARKVYATGWYNINLLRGALCILCFIVQEVLYAGLKLSNVDLYKVGPPQNFLLNIWYQ